MLRKKSGDNSGGVNLNRHQDQEASGKPESHKADKIFRFTRPLAVFLAFAYWTGVFLYVIPRQATSSMQLVDLLLAGFVFVVMSAGYLVLEFSIEDFTGHPESVTFLDFDD